MRFLSAALAIALLPALPPVAHAQPFQGLYVGAGAGYTIPKTVTAAPLTSAFGSTSLELNESGGVTGVGSVGYGFGNGLRLEVEGSYRDAGLRHLSGTPFPTASSGNVKNVRCDGQRHVRHGYRRALAVSVYRRRGGLSVDQPA